MIHAALTALGAVDVADPTRRRPWPAGRVPGGEDPAFPSVVHRRL